MKFIAKITFSFFSNLIALWIAVNFVKGFEIVFDFRNFALVAAIFTLINIFVRPILKFVLSPIIILTFGLGIILVNALMLYLLDILLINITIEGLEPLIYATLIISAVNILINFSAKKLYKETNSY